MKCVLLLLASLLGFTAAFGTFGMISVVSWSNGGAGTIAAHGRDSLAIAFGVLVRRSGTFGCRRQTEVHDDGLWLGNGWRGH